MIRLGSDCDLSDLYIPITRIRMGEALQRLPPNTGLRYGYLLLAFVVCFSLAGCANPAGSEQLSAQPRAAGVSNTTSNKSNSDDYFSGCRQFFAGGKPPIVAYRITDRDLCYDSFAILHSGESKTPVYVAERLNRATVASSNVKRTNQFFPDARIPSSERAALEDYMSSGYDRGHMAPAGDMPTDQAMIQSFSLANMVPQAPVHNRGAWAASVEAPTRKYAGRASGHVYVITGPVYEPSIAASHGIGPGKVRVPKYLFKLVYDDDTKRAWAHWHLNDDVTRGSKPITYAELVTRTGIEFFPGLNPLD